MTQTATNPASAAARTGSGRRSLLGSENTPLSTQKSTHVQEAIAGLQREFISECLRIASLKASHGADNVDIGDDLNTKRDIRIAVENLREAARAFRELGLLKEGEPR